MNTETHLTELLPAYALHCLDAEETAQVEAHLAVCPACQMELRAYEGITADLSLTLPEAVPPAGLKTRLLAEMSPDPSRTAVSPSLWQQIQLFFARPLWQFVTLGLIVVLLVSNILLWQRLNQAEGDLPFGTVTLTGTEAAPNATGIVIISADGLHGTLVVQSLPDLDDAHEYQVWLGYDDQLASGALFNVWEDGYRNVWLRPPEPLIKYTRFSVTIEPTDGSPYPTGPEMLTNKP
jgi:anti-sigma-K factor RskA